MGLGSAQAGAEFARLSAFPAPLHADPASVCYRALGFSPGALPGTDLNGYAKALVMLAGVSSPGTLREVVRGYVGDRSSGQIYGGDTMLGKAFGTLGSGYQRPFELATQRLINMQASLSNCTGVQGLRGGIRSGVCTIS